MEAQLGVTEALCGEIAVISYKSLSAEVVRTVKNCLLDWFAVTLYGSSEPVSELLRGELAQLGQAGPSVGRGAIVGSRDTAGYLDAALLNGTAAHALDYDDTHPDMLGHASAPVIAAALAMGAHKNASGVQLIEAIVCGIEMGARVGRLVNPGHYESGWHATGTLGTLAAAAASARLACSDPKMWRNALGLAATQAAGLKIMFGSMAKPLHAGRAASAGVLAAQLASRGFTSHESVLEADQGFISTASPGMDATTFEVVKREFAVTRTLFKYHASCYLTHGPLEAIRSRLATDEIGSSDISEISISVAEPLMNVCGIPVPTTGLQAKFSLPTVAAMAVLGYDTSDPNCFSDHIVRSADIAAVRDRIRLVVEDRHDSFASVVKIATVSGGEVIKRMDTACPTSDKEAESMRLRTKFAALTRGRLSSTDTDRLMYQIDNVEAVPVNDLLSLTRI